MHSTTTYSMLSTVICIAESEYRPFITVYFTASIHRLLFLTALISYRPSSLPSIPSLIALSPFLLSNSLPPMPSTSYHSDLMFISVLLLLWSPAPPCLLPAVFTYGGPCTRTSATQAPIHRWINHTITCWCPCSLHSTPTALTFKYTTSMINSISVLHPVNRMRVNRRSCTRILEYYSKYNG